MSQIEALDQFFRAGVQNLDAACRAVVASRARQLKTQTQQELRQAFKRRVGGVRVRELPPTAQLGPAAYVSVKPQFLSVFQTGGVIQSRRGLLPVLLPAGRQLGFPRVNKKGLPGVLARYQGQVRVVPSRNGYLVLYRRQGKRKVTEVAIYALVRSVRLKKRLNFYEKAAELSRGMALEIERLVERG